MKKMSKRILCLCLMALLLMTGLVTQAESDLPVQTSPVKIYMLTGMDRETKPDNKLILEELESKTGVMLEVVPIPTEVFNDKINIIFASNEEFDAIAAWDGQHWAALKDRGVLMPLSGLIDQYAPNLKSIFGEEGFISVRDEAGEIWAIPRGVAGGPAAIPGRLVAIRQDWLDALGMEQPTTLAEFEAYLKAVKETDLNGNGRNDEIPLVSENMGYLMSTLAPYFMGSCWRYVAEDGTVAPIESAPNYSLMLETFARWYAEGYLAQDFPSMKSDQVKDAIINNRVGAMLEWYSTHIRPQAELRKVVPEANYLPIPCFTDVPEGGYSGYDRGIVYNHGLKVSVTSTQTPYLMKIYDWLASDAMNLHTLFNGIEGTHWEFVDKEAGTYAKLPDSTALYDSYYSVVFGIQTSAYKLDITNADEVTLEYDISQRIQNQDDFRGRFYFQPDGFIPYSTKGTPAESLSGDGRALLDETVIKVIMGAVSMEEFEGVLAQYMEMEGNILSEVWTSQYKSFTGK